jgi:hypothetical protein
MGYSEEDTPEKVFNYNSRPNAYTVDKGRDAQQVVALIKDLFYSTRKSIYEIFNEAKLGSTVDFDGFNKVVQTYSNSNVNEDEIRSAFKYISKGKPVLSYADFDKIFKWDLPAGGEWETRVIRTIREWMFKNSLSSETLFNLLLKNSNKLLQKRLNRVDFHKALS